MGHENRSTARLPLADASPRFFEFDFFDPGPLARSSWILFEADGEISFHDPLRFMQSINQVSFGFQKEKRKPGQQKYFE